MPFQPLHVHYDRAPIKEAIIDIQIERPISLVVSELEREGVRTRGYSKRHKLFSGHMKGQIEAEKLTATAETDQIGLRYIDAAGKHIAQMRLDGFTF
jgi:hypothetical protein